MSVIAHIAILATLTATPTFAADGPDTSERFREAMAACVLPGPGVEARFDRLESVGWKPHPSSTETVAIFGDAMVIRNPPENLSKTEWEFRRDWALELAKAAPPQGIMVSGAATVSVKTQTETGNPTCFLMIFNSPESDTLFDLLERAGGTVNWGYGRRGEMYSFQPDAGCNDWRTNVSLMSASPAEINPFLDAPLKTTLTVTFVTEPVR